MDRNTTMAFIKDIAARINYPGIYGGVSLMVGAGFSKNAEPIGNKKSPPDWKELADAMYLELYLKPEETDKDKLKKWNQQRIVKTSGKNTLHLAEEYMAVFDRNKMNILIENNVADDMFKPGELHRRLLKLNWKDIFTTNYDTLLERTRDEIFPQRDYRIVLSQDNLPGSGGEKPRIIKLNGSIPGVRPYIISEEDFRCYPMKSAAFVNTVQQALIETTLCMVGFSGDDPNFLSWHGWLHDNLGENCPQIYLIGLFGDINDSEREIFRKRKIALVDLEDLVTGNEKDKYAEAYKKFFNLIESEVKEENFLEQAPYFHRDDLSWKEEEEDEYVAQILEFSNNILVEKEDLVLIPRSERNSYRNYFSEQFKVLLIKCKHINKDYIHALSNLVVIQRMCLMPLYDEDANKLLEICNKLREDQINFEIEWKMQIYLYLLEMYRIDSDEEKYCEIVTECEANLMELPENNKNLYWLERSKHAAGLFDEEEVKLQLGKIQKANVKTSIAKAGLYIQIGEKDIAEKILEECINELEKLKLNSSLCASYKSYLYLCRAMLDRWWIRDNIYSDYEYRNDQYRTRTIIMEMENELKDEIIKTRAKDDTRLNVFEVNYSREEIQIIGENKLQRLSFEFILMLDMLCIPLFYEQGFLIPVAMDKIMATSTDPYWKISFMVRANNNDVVERVLSRRDIAKIDIKVWSKLYDNIWDCVQRTNYKNHDYQHAFFNHINALDIISRIVAFLDDERVIEVIKYIVKIEFNENDHSILDIRNFVSRMSTRFNGKVGEELLEEIFIIADSRICLATYFTSFNMIITDSDRYYDNAISLAGKPEHFDRDNGIAQLLCLWRNCKNLKYKNQIENVLWNGENSELPLTRVFYDIIWEELPHPDEVRFSKLYKECIYDGLVNHISDRAIFRYVNLFYLASPFGSGKYSIIETDDRFLRDILNAIEIELKNRENCNKGIVFWEENTDFFQLRHINELLVMIYAIGIKNENKTDIASQIDRISEMLNSKKINCIALEAVKKGIAGEYIPALDVLGAAVWSNDERTISEVFIGYQAILYVAKEKNGDISLIKDSIIQVIEILQYSDIKVVKDIWKLLDQLIVRIFSEDTAVIQMKLAKIFENCIRSYSYRGIKGDKDYFAALYNCNKTLRRYYDEIKLKNIDIVTSIDSVVEYIKTLNMPELSSIWVS